MGRLGHSTLRARRALELLVSWRFLCSCGTLFKQCDKLTWIAVSHSMSPVEHVQLGFIAGRQPADATETIRILFRKGYEGGHSIHTAKLFDQCARTAREMSCKARRAFSRCGSTSRLQRFRDQWYPALGCAQHQGAATGLQLCGIVCHSAGIICAPRSGPRRTCRAPLLWGNWFPVPAPGWLRGERSLEDSTCLAPQFSIKS